MSASSRILVRAALGGQRIGRLHAVVPPFARRRLSRYVAARVDHSGGELLDDWSRPLVPGVVLAAPPAVRNGPVPAGRARRRSRVGSPIGPRYASGARRCLLATSALDAGGMDEVVAFLARRLRSHGFETAVLHSCLLPSNEGSKGRLARALSADGIEVAVLAEEEGRRWIETWQPDVISGHGALPWVLDEARAMSVPYVDVLHGMHDLFDVDWAAEAKRGPDLSAIIAVSELVRRQYLAGAPAFPAERIITIPNGVDDERRTPVDRAAARAVLGVRDEFLFVSLARHCLQKNTFALVSAFAEVAAVYPDAHLLVAGRVEDRVYCTQVRRLRDTLAVGRDRVHLRDHAADPGLILSAADGFVLGSFFEGWALASMEALHAGVPVVATDVGGAREQIGTDGSRGCVVRNPLGDPLDVNWKSMRSACYSRQVNRDELVAAMSSLVHDRAAWAARRQQLAAESAQRFRPDRCVHEHATVLHGLVDGQARRGHAA